MIKNRDWRTNPKDIKYKLSEKSPVVSASIDSIREFKVDNYSKYVRTKVKIDRSPIDLQSLSRTSAPFWSEEMLFLKELTSGKACLWVYTEDRSWFFYSLDGSQPEQLIYKQYVYNQEYVILENAGFRQQLYLYLQNENTKNMNLKKLEYKEEPLVQYFKRYNSLYGENEQTQTNVKKPEREVFNIKITGSLNYSRLSITNNQLVPFGYDAKYDFGGKINWMGGLELEYFLPFNRNTTSLLFAPTFEHYKNSKMIHNIPLSIDMVSVNFPVGGRYGVYLNDNMKFFFDAYFNSFLGIYKNDGFISPIRTVLNIKEIYNFIFGVGFAYKKWQIELKYHTNRELFSDYVMWNTDYTKVSLSVSYKLLSVKK